MELQFTSDQPACREERGRRCLEILAAVELSKESLARDEGRAVTTREESDQLVSDITGRRMARLAAGQDLYSQVEASPKSGRPKERSEWTGVS